MNRRGIFIVTGTILLIAGLAGIALVQTDIFRFESRTARLEAPAPGISPEPAPSGQSRLEGKLPPLSDKGTQTAQPPGQSPQTGPQASLTEPPAAAPDRTQQTDQFADVVPQPPDVSQGAQAGPTTPIPPVLKGERKYPGRKEIAQPSSRSRAGSAKVATAERRGGVKYNEYTAGAQNPPNRKPVAIRFTFDPLRGGNISLARVHLGDRVVIKVRRIGAADRQLFLGFDLPHSDANISYPRYTRVSGGYGTVITTVRDNDAITLRDVNHFGPALSRKLDSKDGAVLKLGARPPRYGRVPPGPYYGPPGRYEIDVMIYPGNRFNIRPRSLL